MATTQSPSYPSERALSPDEPRPVVRLTGQDGNAFAVLGLVRRALLDAGASKEHVAEFIADATGADYDHLLRTAMRYAEVE